MPKVENTKYKVKIDSLPDGFELIDGELVEKKHGGHVTGDQYNYGLTTFNPHMGESKGPRDTDVRYSLSSVPRDFANIEAEGGETVLTDLNNDGQFGLYDIKGPRHSRGGVPMFLPEQSFIFSDTQKMKMGKEMLADHGIKSRKKMTPAKVSKQYGLNKYYGILNDEYADKIQANTADLMLQKNKEGLSKLAFGQEMMKGFEEGLPLAAYPYVQSIGIDPFEFAEKVKGLQQFTGDEQAQPMNQADTQAMNPMATYGRELNRFIDGGDNPVNPNRFDKFEPMEEVNTFDQPTAGGTRDFTTHFTDTSSKPIMREQPVYDPATDPKLTKNYMTNRKGEIMGQALVPAGENYNTRRLYRQYKRGKVPGESFYDGKYEYGYGGTPMAAYGKELDQAYPGGEPPFGKHGSFDPFLSQYVTPIDSPEVPGAGPFYNDPTVTRDAGNLATRLNRTAASVMNSPGMGMFTGASNFAVNTAGFLNEIGKNRQGRQAQQDLLKMGMADNRMGMTYDPNLSQGIYDANTGLMYDNMQGNPAVGGGFAGYRSFATGGENDEDEKKDDERSWKSGDELMGGTDPWVDWYMSKENRKGRKKRYETFKLLATQRHGVKEEDLPSEEEFHNIYVRAQKQINAIQEFYKDDPDYLKRSDWDSEYEFDPKYKNSYEARGNRIKREVNFRYKKAIKDINDKIKADNPNASEEELNQMLYTALDENGIKIFQTGYQAAQVMDVVDNDEFVDFIQSGVDDDTFEFNDKVYTISPTDAAFGNTTVGQGEKSIIPEYEFTPEKDPDPKDTSDPRPTPDVPDIIMPPSMNIKEPWLQDVIKSQAIADRERGLFLPYQPSVRRESMDVALVDPTRNIAAINSALAGQNQAIGQFAGPQSRAARMAQSQGQAVDALSNQINTIAQNNIQSVNAANQVNAQMAQAYNELEDARRVKEYDDVQKVLQTRMDEKNFDREQYADAMVNLITNMANTGNMNQLYDYFNIDPMSGGDIIQTGLKAFQPNAQQDDWAFMKDYMEAAKRAKTLGLVNKEGNVDPEVLRALVLQKQQSGSYTDPREEAWKAQGREYMSGYGGYGGRSEKDGGEPKMSKWATPFYTGKMGI